MSRHVASSNAGGSVVTTSAPSKPHSFSIASTRSRVGGVTGRPSVKPAANNSSCARSHSTSFLPCHTSMSVPPSLFSRYDNPMQKQQRALIVGGSLGGLFAANMLHALGWHVEVYERVADDLATRGAGIGTHDELFSVMRRLGIAVDASIGVEVRERVCLD